MGTVPLLRAGRCAPAWGWAEPLPLGPEALTPWFSSCCLCPLAQVISGGHYDIDCYVEDPNGKTIYKETKKQYDSFPHRTEVKGIYTFCFSNEFSTFSHKTVYFDFQVGDEPPILPDMSNRVTALTQVGHCVLPWEAHSQTTRRMAVGCSSRFPSAKCRSANRQPTAHATCRPRPPPDDRDRVGLGGLLWV